MAKCTFRFCGGLLEHDVQPGGAVVTRCPRCERRLAGLCRDCPRPVYGAIGRAIRCAECAAAARATSRRRSEEDPEIRKRKNAQWRKRWRTDRAFRERRKARRKEWEAAHPEARKRHRRRYHLKRTPGYVAGYMRANARPERAEKKRRQALERYYRLHPVRPAPVCAKCGEPIAWKPPGRPPKYHPEHSPWKKQLKAYRDQSAA